MLVHNVRSVQDLVALLGTAYCKTHQQMVALSKYMSIGEGKRILKCFQIPVELTVRSSCYTISSSTIYASIHLTYWLRYNQQTPQYGCCWQCSPSTRTPCRALNSCCLIPESAEQSGSPGTWCRGGFRQARWVRMYGNSPVTVQLDAQVPWCVTHDSEPSMLAPIGAPAATSQIFSLLFTHGFVTTCRGQSEVAAQPFAASLMW